jgi:uncharacterized protein (DUF305 family)
MNIRLLLAGVATLSLSGLALAQTNGFARASDAAMRQMYRAMMVGYTGDPDRDFARMMIPHHQGAIDRAMAELSFGKDERLRRLAQGIIVEQRQEIAVMQGILSAPSALSPRNVPASSGHDHTGVHR